MSTFCDRGVALLTVLAMLSGCAHHDATDATAPAAPGRTLTIADMPPPPAGEEPYGPDTIVGQPVDPHALTPTELHYGTAPKRDSRVTYGDDVVLMENGDRAIQAAATNGMTWTIDAHAPGADQIAEGKILFATRRAVGRVLHVERTADAVSVILGPAQINDVIKEGDFVASQSIDQGNSINYYAPDYPGAIGDSRRNVAYAPIPEMPGQPSDGGFVRFASDMQIAPADPNLPAGAANAIGNAASGANGIPEPTIGALPPMRDIQGFQLGPCGCEGLGLSLSHKDPNLAIDAATSFTLSAPRIYFRLKIVHGTVTDADVTVYGAAGLHVSFDAASPVGLSGNVHKTIYMPVDITWPIGGMAVPLSVTARNSITLSTGFSVKNSTLSAKADYRMAGSLTVGYVNGRWQAVGGPSELHTDHNLAQDIDGMSAGINSLVLAYGARVMVGIGAFGFATGPYVSFSAGASALRAPSMGNGAGPGMVAGGVGMMPCNQGTFDIDLGGGIGYKMPQALVDGINFFLRAFNLQTLQADGSLVEIKPPLSLVSKVDNIPRGCSSPNGSAAL